MMMFQKLAKNPPQKRHSPGISGAGEDGSIIVIALVVLAILTLGGISAARRSMTESFIVRNTGLYKENLQLADAAAMMGLRATLAIDPDDLRDNAYPEVWTHRVSDWNDNPFDPHPGDSDSYPLDDANSMVPEPVKNSEVETISNRGEANAGTLRYYFVGWSPVAGQSLSLGQAAIWRSGRVVGEYVSDRFGSKTVDIGVVRRF